MLFVDGIFVFFLNMTLSAKYTIIISSVYSLVMENESLETKQYQNDSEKTNDKKRHKQTKRKIAIHLMFHIVTLCLVWLVIFCWTCVQSCVFCQYEC